MSKKAQRLPSRFPVGAKYVVEHRGSMKAMMLMHRYVEFPDGRQIELAARLVPACGQSAGAVKKPSPTCGTRRSRRPASALTPA